MAHRNVSVGHTTRRVGARDFAIGALLVLAVASIGFVAPVAAQEKPSVSPEERAAALLRPAVVYIETFWAGFVSDEDGIYFNDGSAYEFSSSCTGFVVNPAGHIMTAGHCVDDSASFGGIKRTMIEIAAQEAFEAGTYEGTPPVEDLFEFGLANWAVEGPAKGSPVQREVFVQRGIAVSGEQTGEALPARLIDFRSAESGDVALLKVEQSALPSVLVSDVNELEIGTPLLSVGYPALTEGAVDQSLEPTNKDGKVSAKKTQGSFPVYEVSAAIASGMSGGPTVNLEGEVIGVNSFGIGDSEAFNFIVPAGNIREVMARNGVTNELGRTDTLYREGLTAYYAGRYTPAITAFDSVLDLDPAHQQAQEVRQAAARERAEGGEVSETTEEGGGSTFPVVPVVLGVLVLGGIGGGLYMMNRSKKPAGELPAAGATSAWSPTPPPTIPMPPPAPTLPPVPDPVAADVPSPIGTSPPSGPLAGPLSTPSPVPAAATATPTATPVAASPLLSAATSTSPAEHENTSNGADESEAGSKFCQSCGAKASSATVFCGSCGTKF